MKNKATNKDGYPEYPASEDIYKKSRLEENIDPEDLSKVKDEVKESGEEVKPLNFSNGKITDDLDVPGSELDDEDELTGNEDEENNSYSIGGDNHHDLEEEEN